MDEELFQYDDLELTPEQMHEMGRVCINIAVQHIKDLPESPRSGIRDAGEIVKNLRESVPETPMNFDALISILMKQVFPHTINTAHPEYLGYIPGGGLYISALADFLGSALNRYAGVWYAGPTLSRIEANVIEWFAEGVGFPKTTRGILTSGGSLAHFSAVVTARESLLGDDLSKGIVYASDQTHHSLIKSAMLAGIPQKNIKLLKSDQNFRADVDLFRQEIQRDIALGMRPFLIVGNAGTTNSGAVDSAVDLAGLACEFDCWFHIDGAYGGFFNLCDEGKRRLPGIERADSIILDPHKGLFVPYGTGCLLVKDGEKLRKAHMLDADYLQDMHTPSGECNFAEYSPELSRPFRGLRIWLPLKYYGMKAFRTNLDEKLAISQWMYQQFQKTSGFVCASPLDLTIFAFYYKPGNGGDPEKFTRRLLKEINASERLFLSSTRLNNIFVIRICVLSFRTHLKQIKDIFAFIVETARRLEREWENE